MFFFVSIKDLRKFVKQNFESSKQNFMTFVFELWLSIYLEMIPTLLRKNMCFTKNMEENSNTF